MTAIWLTLVLGIFFISALLCGILNVLVDIKLLLYKISAQEVLNAHSTKHST